jgi:hypothetical protein
MIIRSHETRQKYITVFIALQTFFLNSRYVHTIGRQIIWAFNWYDAGSRPVHRGPILPVRKPIYLVLV